MCRLLLDLLYLRHLCERNQFIYHQTPAQNEGIQIHELIAKAQGGQPKREDYEVGWELTLIKSFLSISL